MTDEETWDFHRLVKRFAIRPDAAEALTVFIDGIIGRVDEEAFDRGVALSEVAALEASKA